MGRSECDETTRLASGRQKMRSKISWMKQVEDVIFLTQMSLLCEIIMGTTCGADPTLNPQRMSLGSRLVIVLKPRLMKSQVQYPHYPSPKESEQPQGMNLLDEKPAMIPFTAAYDPPTITRIPTAMKKQAKPQQRYHFQLRSLAFE